MSFHPSQPGGAPLGGLRRQCLFAVTILLVEDSRCASEAIRLYAAESGARVRRADSLHAASRHLAVYRPNVVMVDLGLPDGDGMALIRQLTTGSSPISGIVALSGHDRHAWCDEATAAGAAACLEKPIASLKVFQQCVLSVLPDAETRRGPDQRELALLDNASIRSALADDLQRAKVLLREAMEGNDRETIAYCAQFLGSVGEMLSDADLASRARAAAAEPAAAAGLFGLLCSRIPAVGVYGRA
jgi:DNA-binding response OmpR family regulator